jgi:hypothetical protein
MQYVPVAQAGRVALALRLWRQMVLLLRRLYEMHNWQLSLLQY